MVDVGRRGSEESAYGPDGFKSYEPLGERETPASLAAHEAAGAARHGKLPHCVWADAWLVGHFHWRVAVGEEMVEGEIKRRHEDQRDGLR